MSPDLDRRVYISLILKYYISNVELVELCSRSLIQACDEIIEVGISQPQFHIHLLSLWGGFDGWA